MSDDDKRATATSSLTGDDGLEPAVPVGIEELLAMAAVDRRFARELLERRPEAIAASGIPLRPTEAEILTAVDDAALRQMVANVGDSITEPDRRTFLARSAAALLVMAGGGVTVAATSGCPERVKGTDKPRSRPVRSPAMGETGVRPDRPAPARKAPATKPAPAVDAKQRVRPPVVAPTGIRPDRPGPSRGK